VGEKGSTGWYKGNGGFGRGRKGKTWNEDIGIGRATAFGGYYGVIIFGGDFVDDTDKTFSPAGFVVFFLFIFVTVVVRGRGKWKMRKRTICRIGETWFGVGDSWEVECES